MQEQTKYGFNIGDIISFDYYKPGYEHKWEVIGFDTIISSRLGEFKIALKELRTGKIQGTNLPEKAVIVEKGFVPYDPNQQKDLESDL